MFENWAWGGYKPHSSYEKIELWNELHADIRYFEHWERMQDVLQEMYDIFEKYTSNESEHVHKDSHPRDTNSL